VGEEGCMGEVKMMKINRILQLPAEVPAEGKRD